METSVSALTTSVMVFLTVTITQMRLIAVSILILKERFHLLGDASENFLYLLYQIIGTTVLKTSKFVLGKFVHKSFFLGRNFKHSRFYLKSRFFWQRVGFAFLLALNILFYLASQSQSSKVK